MNPHKNFLLTPLGDAIQLPLLGFYLQVLLNRIYYFNVPV